MFGYVIFFLIVVTPMELMFQFYVNDLKKHKGNEDAIKFWRFMQIVSPLAIILCNL